MTKRVLTALMVERARPRGKRYEIPDAALPGFALRVSENGAKSYVVRYRIKGKQRRLTLGSTAVLQLGDARQNARDTLVAVREGRDPAVAEPEAEPDRNTCATVAADYVKRYLKPNTRRWRDAEQMLARDVLSTLGERDIRSITKRDVLDLIDAIVDRGSPVSANRCLSLIKRFLGWAAGRGIPGLDINVAAGIKAQNKEQSRDRVLDSGEIAAVWQAFTAMAYPFGVIGQLLFLSGLRRGEIAGLRWAEVDLEKAMLRLPAERMKGGRAHEAPLPPAAVEILRQVPRVDGAVLVFPAGRPGSVNSVSGFSRAVRIAQRVSGVGDWGFPDIRRTVRSKLGELGIPPHISERLLAHVVGSAVERVYDRYQYAGEMRQAVERWSIELKRIVSGGQSKVVPMRRLA